MSAERKFSVTLFIVSTASTKTLFPFVILNCISISSDRHSWVKFTPQRIANGFYYLNSILNPVIYAIRLSEFRRALKELFCKNTSYPVRRDQPIELQAMQTWTVQAVLWINQLYVNIKCIHRISTIKIPQMQTIALFKNEDCVPPKEICIKH